MKSFVLHDESLNSYGFWMLTSGLDLTQFQKNPIMLWNHNRGGYREEENQVLPIGHWENIRVENNRVLADPVFDSDAFSQKIAAKVESGTLRMASIGGRPIEESEDPIYLKPGQKYATVLKFKVREASITDIGSNDNALAFYDDNDQLIELSSGNTATIPLKELDTNQNNKKMKEVAKILNLADNATEADMVAAIKPLQDDNVTLREDLQKEKDEKIALQQKLEAIELADKTAKKTAFEAELGEAFKDGRLSEKPEGDKLTPVKDRMLNLFDKDPEGTLQLVKDLPKHRSSINLSDVTPPEGETAWDKRQREIEENAKKK